MPYGLPKELDNEIAKAIENGTAYSLLSGGGIPNSPGIVELVFNISKDYPLVTLVSMIAPSPDWFVGVSALNLIDLDMGNWTSKMKVDLYAYDAGTDSGINYTSSDDPTDPPISIFKIEGYPFFYEDELTPLGNFVFKKL